MSNTKAYGNIALLARKDLAESRLVAGKNSDVLYNRGYYKLFCFLRVAAFSVSAFFLLILLISYLYQLGSDGLSDAARSSYRLSFNNLLLPFFLLVFGFALTCPQSDSSLKAVINTVGSVFSVASGAWLAYYIFTLMREASNYYDGGLEKYLLRHLIPLAVFVLLTVFLYIKKIIEYRTFKKRYNDICREAYNKFSEAHADGGYSDAEWREYIGSYSRDARAFPLKRSQKNRMRKQLEEEK